MLPNGLWGYLLPIGLLLLTWGGLPPQKARRMTPWAVLATAVAVLGYWAVGFAFHMGGAHAINPEDASLAGLDVMFAPSGAGWGLLGLRGFFLAGAEMTPTVFALFLAYLPLIVAAVTLTTLTLADARPWLAVLAGFVAATVVLPSAACWMWGSGWLAHLGETLGWGHGFVDFGGSALVLWLPGMMALGILLLQPRPEALASPPPPPAYFPLLANVGVLFLGLGWMGWALSEPFHTFGATLDWHQAAVNVLLGMSGAVLTAQLYAWLVTGELASLLAARGIAAGWASVLACAPFVPPWAALVVGLLAGLAFSLLHYVADVLLRLREAAAPVALGLSAGLWSLLSVAIFANGRWGQGWNQMGAPTGNGALGIGVAGLISTGNLSQFKAQIVGLLAVGAWGLLWGVILGFVANPRLPHFRAAERLDETRVLEDEDTASSDAAAQL